MNRYSIYYSRFDELFVLFEIAFRTSSCNVDGGSDRISVVVDKYRSLSETAVRGEKIKLKTNLKAASGNCDIPGRISIKEQC